MSLTAPRSLSPSRVTAFTACPLAFRLRSIDHLPEPPSPAATKGTLVHTALERLMWTHPQGTRSPDTARGELDRAFDELRTTEEWAELALEPADADAFVDDGRKLVANYFKIEDPDAVNPVGVELMIQSDIGGLVLRGILDRLDLTDDGRLVVIDYKTGRAPGERYEQAKLTAVHLYALLCEQAFGQAPAEVRLLHLREPLTIVAVPTAQSIRGQQRRTMAIFQAIERACTRLDFRPHPSSLCGYCSYHEYCPVYGGEPPALS